jgi:chromate transporter
MTETLRLSLQATDWLHLFLHFLALSLLSLGGAIATAPDMHRYLVSEQHWLTDPQFSSSVALAQAAPGPNVLFVALVGWNVGLNAGDMLTGVLGMAVAIVGILLPSTIVTYNATRWAQRNRELRVVRAFKQGMGPVVVGLVLATGWILTNTHESFSEGWRLWLLTIVTVPIILKTRIHILWLLVAGAVLGWFGWV